MIKKALLKQGWAGITISRAETIERLNPLLLQHRALNHAHNYAIEHLQDREIARQLAGAQRIARADVGKLSETILSCGGVAYTGTDMEPGYLVLGTDDDTILFALLDRERAFIDALKAESEVEHQMRTRAIIGAVLANSEQRYEFLHQNTRQRRRTALAKRT